MSVCVLLTVRCVFLENSKCLKYGKLYIKQCIKITEKINIFPKLIYWEITTKKHLYGNGRIQ